MSDGMGREPAYLSSHATNRYFIPNWGLLLTALIRNFYKTIIHRLEVKRFGLKATSRIVG